MAFGRIGAYVSRHGLRWTLRRGAQKAAERYLRTYERKARQLAPTEEELREQRAHQPDAGLVSVIVPVFNTRPELLEALAQSLAAQTYERWEACLYDGGSPNPLTREALLSLARRDARIRVTLGDSNDGISGNSNHALAMAKGRYIVLCDHDDLLTPDALWQVARTAAETGAELIYSDEDRISEDGARLTDPHMKPGFCPDNLRSGNYICHLMAVKRTLMDEVGAFRPGFDGSQDHDLALRCAERAGSIAHIARVLYHWRMVGGSMSRKRLSQCQEAGCRAVEEHMRRIGWSGSAVMESGVIRLRYALKRPMTLRALVLSRREGDERACISALRRAGLADTSITVLYAKRDRWQARVNRAAAEAEEDALLIIRASALAQGADFLTEMLMYAQRGDVGMVTPVALRRGSIVSAGYALMRDGRVLHRSAGTAFASGGWHAIERTSHNVAAVSSICLMVRRDHYLPLEESGSAETALVQSCIAMSRGGLVHVYTPHAAVQYRGRPPETPVLCTPVTDGCMSEWHLRGKRADYRVCVKEDRSRAAD